MKAQKKRFKPFMAILLTVIMLTLNGCSNNTEITAETPNENSSSESKTITICFDSLNNSSLATAALRDSIESVSNQSSNITVNIETVPGGVILSESEVGERDNYLTRIRTEIMAGEGPDLFICVSPRPARGTEKTNLKGIFPYPESAMESGLFLQLDEYIKNSDMIDWDSLQQQIMNVGNHDNKQYIIPLTYTFGITGFNLENHSIDANFPMTRMDQISNKDTAVCQSAHTGELYSVFGRIADYKKDVLTFDRDDLELYFTQYLSYQCLHNEMISDTPLGLPMGLPNILDNNGRCKFGGEEKYAFIPQYNDDGGVTAYVTSYVVINRNTTNPEEAFSIVEMLLSKEGQQHAPLYGDLYGMPTHIDIGQKDSPAYSPFGPWHMNDANFDEFCKVRDQINAVNFFTPLEMEIDDLMQTCFETEITEDELKNLVSETYRVMTMMIGES